MNALRRWWPDLLIVVGVTWLAFACSAYAGDGNVEGELDQGGGDVAGDISIGYTQNERLAVAAATALTTIGVLGKINQRRSSPSVEMRLAEFSDVPVIDVAPLVMHTAERSRTADQIGSACRESGFFYVVNHGVDESLCKQLEASSREFFAQAESQKMQVAMSRGGRAWRGYFPVGRELTSGKPDRKEGLYFGAELPLDHPAVRAGTPLHGPNLFPAIPGFRETVLRYVDSLTALGHALMSGISLGLGLDEHYFKQHYYRDPLILFRIFNYPHASASQSGETAWGVGEHTDYGLLTILRQDDTGGLQVKSRSRWIDAPPIPGSFLCNIGDMLERLTRGIYRSTPHRVINTSLRDRLSFPFFFDPSFDARMLPVEGLSNDGLADDSAERWDRTSVHEFSGTYGDYLLNKVSKVFPELRNEVL